MTTPFYVTTPIYYVNGAPHIGHAYTTLAADTLARWARLQGRPTYFLTGTDEHGLKIEQSARKAGVEPLVQASRFSDRFSSLWTEWGITHDDFIRTTEERHKAVVADMWNRMVAAGDIYEDKYEGWYSVGDEAYFTEDELVDGKAPSGHAVEWVVEPSYFFRLSKYGDRLLEHLRAHPEFVRPRSRYNELVSFVEGGLQDISVSRTTFSWGVPVPGADGHVIYVWVDALTNYISALGGPDGDSYATFWPHVLHMLGKDILRFHAVYWPCFLMSAGLPLPDRLFVHGWWTHDGAKMSKTLGNVVDPRAMAAKYGLDAFRYFLLREVSFGSDGDFSEQALCNRLNGDLANDLGNLHNRTLGMLGRYRDGVVPPRGTADAAVDGPLLAAFEAARDTLYTAMDEVAFHRALAAIWSFSGAANKYVADTAPWKLAKAGEDARLNEVLYTLCEALRVLGIWTQAFIPEKATRLLDDLGVAADDRMLAQADAFGGLASGTRTHPSGPLFAKLDPPEKAAAPAAPPKPAKKNTKTKKAKTPSGPAESIEYGDFARLALRVALITAAEKHPDADRLLKLEIDVGEPERRTVCAGIAATYAPADLIGRRAVLLANLAPRKIRGVESQGMLLAAGEGADVRLIDPGPFPPGTVVS